MNRHNFFSRGFWGVVALVSSHAALADDDQRGHGVTLLPKYKLECAACHVAVTEAYPPPE